MIIGSKLTKTTDFDWKPFLSSLSDLSEYDEAIRKNKQLLLLLLLSHFSHVRLCATPRTAAYQAPPSLGFSRQEHWSGLHFLLQCMRAKSESEVAQSCLTLRDPMDCSPPGSSIHGIFQARVLEQGAIAFSNWYTGKRQILSMR